MTNAIQMLEEMVAQIPPPHRARSRVFTAEEEREFRAQWANLGLSNQAINSLSNESQFNAEILSPDVVGKMPDNEILRIAGLGRIGLAKIRACLPSLPSLPTSDPTELTRLRLIEAEYHGFRAAIAMFLEIERSRP